MNKNSVIFLPECMDKTVPEGNYYFSSWKTTRLNGKETVKKLKIQVWFRIQRVRNEQVNYVWMFNRNFQNLTAKVHKF